MEDLDELLEYQNSTPEERDYSIIGDFTPQSAYGRCMYCNHCQPCPAHIDVSMVNKYYDLAKVGDVLAKDHYKQLDLHASDCLHCEHCNETCPFHVDQSKKMSEIEEYFGY